MSAFSKTHFGAYLYRESRANPDGLILFAMLETLDAYVDASGHDAEHETVLAVSGCLSTGARWSEFEREWEDYLKQAGFPRTPRTKRYVFHATDLANPKNTQFTGHQKQTIRRDLLALIKKHALFCFGRAMFLDEFREVEQAIPYMRELIVSEPGAFLSHEFFLENGAWAKANGYETAISYMFDRGDSFYGHVNHGYNLSKYFMNNEYEWEDGEYLTVSSIGEGNKDLHPSLQAADLLAWYTRRNVLERKSIRFRSTLASAVKPYPEMADLSAKVPFDFKVYGREAIRIGMKKRVAASLHRMGIVVLADLLFDESRTQEQNDALINLLLYEKKKADDERNKANQDQGQSKP